MSFVCDMLDYTVCCPLYILFLVVINDRVVRKRNISFYILTK